MTSIRNKLGWGLSAALALLLLAALAGVVHGGPLDPPGPVAPTGKTVITSLPFTISQPGSYILNGDLTGSSGDGVTIQTDWVTIDLNGFTLFGASGTASGISEGPSAPMHVGWTIRNGTVAGWGNSGIFAQHLINSTFEDLHLSFNGFSSGSEALRAGQNIDVRNVKVTGNSGSGIVLGPEAQVSDCFVDLGFANTIGISAGEQSTIRNCSLNGIQASNSAGISAGPRSQASDCSVRAMGGTGISVGDGSTVTGCVADANVGSGILVTNQTVVRGCTSQNNGGSGIVFGSNNRIESNHALFNSVAGFTTQGQGLNNVVVLNSAHNNAPGLNYNVSPASNQFTSGPVSGATNPWANIDY